MSEVPLYPYRPFSNYGRGVFVDSGHTWIQCGEIEVCWHGLARAGGTSVAEQGSLGADSLKEAPTLPFSIVEPRRTHAPDTSAESTGSTRFSHAATCPEVNELSSGGLVCR